MKEHGCDCLAVMEYGEKTLREIGLGLLQARVYLALLRIGKYSSVKVLSVSSKVARQDVYRTITELRELDLVEMVIGNPALFKAIPLQQTVAILMEKKNQRTQILMKEVVELFNHFDKNNENTLNQENHQFILVPKREVLVSRIKKTIEGTKESILISTPWRESTQWLFNLHESWQLALKKGVKIRWLTEKQTSPSLVDEISCSLIKNPNFTLRANAVPLKVRFVVYDDKEVFMMVLDAPNAGESPALWSNNPAYVYLLKDYFETKWALTVDYDLDKLIV
jgi:sugar-specific transcriptional regulator TrmB